jgi:hypothetical protein
MDDYHDGKLIGLIEDPARIRLALAEAELLEDDEWEKGGNIEQKPGTAWNGVAAVNNYRAEVRRLAREKVEKEGR